VSFVAADARVADLSAGTVFFLFTPFKGEVFSRVMERVRLVALGRRVRVIGYGPCTEEIARLGWLRRVPDGNAEVDAMDGRDKMGLASGEYMLQTFSNFRAHD
jgi:hypothetical protein